LELAAALRPVVPVADDAVGACVDLHIC
jgi:hypothetical protein